MDDSKFVYFTECFPIYAYRNKSTRLKGETTVYITLSECKMGVLKLWNLDELVVCFDAFIEVIQFDRTEFFAKKLDNNFSLSP